MTDADEEMIRKRVEREKLYDLSFEVLSVLVSLREETKRDRKSTCDHFGADPQSNSPIALWRTGKLDGVDNAIIGVCGAISKLPLKQ